MKAVNFGNMLLEGAITIPTMAMAILSKIETYKVISTRINQLMTYSISIINICARQLVQFHEIW
jgi:hypothetical protein